MFFFLIRLRPIVNFSIAIKVAKTGIKPGIDDVRLPGKGPGSNTCGHSAYETILELIFLIIHRLVHYYLKYF